MLYVDVESVEKEIHTRLAMFKTMHQTASISSQVSSLMNMSYSPDFYKGLEVAYSEVIMVLESMRKLYETSQRREVI